jgi:hypothetical protein
VAVGLVTCWYPAEGHPDGPSESPWFEVVGSMVYPAPGHPDGAHNRPWFQVRGDLAFAVDGHPDAGAPEPWYRKVGGHWLPASGDWISHGGAALFREAD